jgi:dihydrofolate synthase/folylpolyglutamate synthase
MGWADWPARLQHLARGPLVGDREAWLDGGHNPSAARQIATYAKHHFDDGKPLHLIFASLTTKDPGGMLEPFAGIVRHVHTVPIPDHSCFLPDDLAEIAADQGFSVDSHDDVGGALGAIPTDARVLIFGSLYLAGFVLAANDQVPN